MMKKMIAVTLIATTMFTAIPAKKAEAGVVMMMDAVANNRDGDQFGAGGLLLIMGIGCTYSVWGQNLVGVNAILGALGMTFFMLDEAQGPNAYESALIQKYPFIDNSDVTAQLASSIAKKYAEKKDAKGNAFVSISAEETRSILAQTDLSDEEIEHVVNDLK